MGTEWIYKLTDQFTKPLEDIFEGLDLTDRAAQRTEDSLTDIGTNTGATEAAHSFDLLKGSIVDAASGFALYDIGKTVMNELAGSIMETYDAVVQTTGQYQKFNAILTTSFQSADLAKEAFDMLEKFATKTPYNLDQVIGSFIKMRAQGFTPTYEELFKLGDFASSMGKDFDQLAEAVLDAQTGEFERLKEFGVKADAHGNKIKFTFKGVTTEVDKQASSVRSYLLGLGDQAGVLGSMAGIMDTWPGKLANIEDAQAKLHVKLGDLFSPAIGSWLDFKANAIQGMMDMVDWLTAHQQEIEDFFEAITVGIGIAGGAWMIMNAQWLIGQAVAGGALLVVGLLDLAMWGLAAAEAAAAAPLTILIGVLAATGAFLYYCYEQSETFRATVWGVWESVKVLGAGIVDFAITPFKLWFDLVKATGKVLMGIINWDFAQIGAGITEGLDAFKAANPLEKAKRIGAEMGTAYQTGYNESLAKDAAEAEAEAKAEAEKKSVVTATNAANPTTPTNPAKPTADASGGGAAVGGAGGSRSVNVRIDTLAKVYVSGANAQEILSQIDKKLNELLIGTVRDFEVTLSNQ